MERLENMGRKLLFATGNQAKLTAMRRKLAELDLEILGLSDMEQKAPPVPEDGNTPLENARQKALAYYDFFRVPLFSCDSGLYFEGLPDALQPGVHVRTVGGKHLTDEQMLAYYGGLAEEYGNLRARYRHAVCLVTGEGQIYEAMDESMASEIFLITAVPCREVRQKGFPLDSLSRSIRTGKYFYDMDGEEPDHLTAADGVLNFFRRLGWWDERNLSKG